MRKNISLPEQITRGALALLLFLLAFLHPWGMFWTVVFVVLGLTAAFAAVTGY